MSFLDEMIEICNRAVDEARKEMEAQNEMEARKQGEGQELEEIMLDTIKLLHSLIRWDPHGPDVPRYADSIAKLYEAYGHFTDYNYDC